MKPETYKRILEDATGTFDKSKKEKLMLTGRNG